MFREAWKIIGDGKATLVSVEELEKTKKYSISVKERMFVCPDCGEYVGFVYSINKSSYFMHEKSDGTRKCEIYVKRISSNQTYTPYERAGLPLYLLKIGSNFCINIGFYPVSRQALEAAAAKKLGLTILTDKGYRIATKYINEESFSSYTTSFVQVDKEGSKYHLYFSDKKLPPEIAKKWAGDIQGIEFFRGAFFKYNEYGGIRVRKSEAIIVGTDYYLVCQFNPTKFVDNMLCRKVGEIHLLKDNLIKITFDVYVVRFTEITERNLRFCLDYYNILLLNKTPELNPLWPPCNKREQTHVYECKQNAKFLLKTSGQEERKVFVYPEKQAIIKVLDKNKAIACIPVDEIERPVSIERAERIFAFTVVAKDREEMRFNSEVIAEDDKSNSFSAGEYTKLPHNNRIRIKTRFKGTVYVFHNDVLKYLRSIDGSVWLDDVKHGTVIKVFHGLDPVFELKFRRLVKTRHKEEEEKLVKELMYRTGNDVSTPVSFKYILPRLISSPKLYEHVNKAIKKGYVNKTVMHRILRSFYRITGERG